MSKKPSPLRDLTPYDLADLPYAQYVRESTAEQRHGFGPEAQRAANRSFAERYGLLDTGVVYEEYLSGKSMDNRPQLAQALADMRTGRYRVLLVGWPHRLSRSTGDADRLKKEIRAAGGILVYSALGLVSEQRASRLGENVMHALDQEYRQNLSDLVMHGLEAKFKAGGANGLPPLGTTHTYVRRDGSICPFPDKDTRARRVLNPEELPVLRTMLTRYAELGSYRETALWLNGQGHRTRKGEPFAASSVKSVIGNPFYGPEEIVVYHGKYDDTIQRPTPPDARIFPEDVHTLWLRCQERRGRRSRALAAATPIHVYPLHPVLRCATCGCVYHGQWFRSYRLSVHTHAPLCTSPGRFRSTLLEEHLAECLAAIPLPSTWRTQIRRLLATPAPDDSAAERTRLTKRLDKLRVQHDADLIDDATLVRESRALRAALEQLAARSPQPLDAYREPARYLRSIGTIIGHPAMRDRTDGQLLYRQFCELAFARIEAEGSRLVKIVPNAQYAELFAVSVQARCAGVVRPRGLHPPPPLQSTIETSRGPVDIGGIEPILAALEGVA